MPDYATLDLGEVIQEACEQAGIILRGADQYKSARRSLALLLMEWSAIGINLWSVKETQITCIEGQAEYAQEEGGLPDDFLDFVDASIREISPYGTVDYHLDRMGWAQYEAIHQKDLPGRPSRILRVPGLAPKIRLWEVPDKSTYTLRMWYLARVPNPSATGKHAGDPSNEVHVPAVFLPALCAGLAAKMAAKSLNEASLMRTQMLNLTYQNLLTNAVEFMRDRSSLYLRPEVR